MAGKRKGGEGREEEGGEERGGEELRDKWNSNRSQRMKEFRGIQRHLALRINPS